jgi:hypothetical protein
MTGYDRLRIKLEAWGDACFRYLPTIMILAGVALVIAAVFGFCTIWHPTPVRGAP